MHATEKQQRSTFSEPTPRLRPDYVLSKLHECFPKAAVFTVLPDYIVQSHPVSSTIVNVPQSSSNTAIVTESTTTATPESTTTATPESTYCHSRVNNYCHSRVNNYTATATAESTTTATPESTTTATATAESTTTNTVTMSSAIDPSLPHPLTDLYDPNAKVLSSLELDQACSRALAKIKVTQDECYFLEKSTVGQSKCLTWYEHRKGRITASHFYNVSRHIVANSTTFPRSVVDSIMQYSNQSIDHVPAIRWGIENEGIAREAYTTKMQLEHRGVRVRCCGLTINPDYPVLGASPAVAYLSPGPPGPGPGHQSTKIYYYS